MPRGCSNTLMPKPKRSLANSKAEHNVLRLVKGLENSRAERKDRSVPHPTIDPIDPSQLTDVQENLVIEYLHYAEGLTNVEIGEYVERSQPTITRRIKEITERRIAELSNGGITLMGQAEKLIKACELVQRKARDVGDWALYLKAGIDTHKELQKLGLVHEEPQKIDGVLEIFNAEETDVLIAAIREAIEIKSSIPQSRRNRVIEGEILEGGQEG